MSLNVLKNKNFFQEYWNYVLLGISNIGLLGAGIYYVVINNQSRPVAINQNKVLKEKNQEKKQKLEKVILDPVIDNIYWSIASFIVYYLIYLGLRYSGYKDHTFWVIPTSVILGKLGLITFSSYYYQKNDFLQNLNKSINPVYFINQNIYQIILSLVGYLGLVALIYFDRKKELGQQPGQGNQDLNLNEQNQVHDVHQKPLSEQEKQELMNYFDNAIISFIRNKSFEKIITSLKTEGLFDFDQFIDRIRQNIQNEKINKIWLRKLISRETSENVSRIKNDNFFDKQRYKYPFLNCFFTCLHFFFEKGDVKGMVDTYLAELMKDPDINKMNLLKKLVNEIYYFGNCIQNIFDRYFNKENFYIGVVGMENLKTIERMKSLHLKIVRGLVADNNAENFFEKEGMRHNQCRDINRLYRFLADSKNQIILQKKTFIKIFYLIYQKEV